MSIFGHLLRVTTFGESHGRSVGCVIDGLPPGLELSESDIQVQLNRRRPGQSILTTPRNEGDVVAIQSGLDGGRTIGTPLCLLVKNKDQRQFDYANVSTIPRPGHADYTYHIKYNGHVATSGGGRASARETIGRVAAGAVIAKWLEETYSTSIVCWVSSVGPVAIPEDEQNRLISSPLTQSQVDALGTIDLKAEEPKEGAGDKSTDTNAKPNTTKVFTRCPHPETARRMAEYISEVKEAGDSCGGIVTCVIRNPPIGLGEPCFDKTEALLASAMMSLPATKGFEIGEGFKGTLMRGSEHNDRFTSSHNTNDGGVLLKAETNHAGGTLGGITTGHDIVFRVAFKPVSSISVPQETYNYDGNAAVLGVKGRHDPCVLPRTPPLIESMAALVIGDLALIQRARVGNRGGLPILPTTSSTE